MALSVSELEAEADRFHYDDEWEQLRADIIQAFFEGMSLATIMRATGLPGPTIMGIVAGNGPGLPFQVRLFAHVDF